MMTQSCTDLRGLPVWERAAIVLERCDTLTSGESFEFLMDLDPRALMARLDQQRPGELRFEYRQLGENAWNVKVWRVHVEDRQISIGIALARNPTFAELGEGVRARLAEAATEHVARKGENLTVENGRCDAIGLAFEGTLAVFVGAGTRERLLFHVYPFETFAQSEFFDRGSSIGRTVVLSKQARYATIPYDAVREIGLRNPTVLLDLAASIAQRNRTLASALAAQVSQPIIARIAGALLPYAVPERGLQPALPPLSTMTQAQIAAAAGTVKEVAARAIAELERMQALRRKHGHIAYVDRSRLLELVDES